MKTILRYFLFLGIFFVLLWGAFYLFFWIDRKQEKKLVTRNSEKIRLTSLEINKLEEGDIILRRGYGYFSDMIANRLNDSIFDVTHSGILYKKQDVWFVIHSLSSDASDFDGMQEQPLSEFLKYSVPNKVLVVRPKNVTPAQAQKVVERAKYYLQQKIPFDHFGVIDEPSKMYCTELIWQILDTDLKIITLPRDKAKRKNLFYSMKGTYDTKYFDIIVNTYPPN